jgi:hypothetical protein
VPTFLELFLEASVDSESPKSYWFWSGLSCISAVAKRNVYIQRPTWRTYPNIFVFLVGESGLRKGVPINIAKELVTTIDTTRVVSGRGSIQGIITDLGSAHTREDGRVFDKAQAFIVASEFSSSIVRDQDALTILTDLYDSCYHDKWPITLKSGKWILKEPSITLLAGINPPHFEDFVGPVAIGGGFVGRLMIIYEQEKATINPAIRKEKFKPLNKDPLLDRLRRISRLQGEMDLTESAKQIYEQWYIEFENHRKNARLQDKTGAINRIAEHMLKVAMLLALSREDLVINELDINVAKQVCTTTLAHSSKATIGQGKSQFAPQIRIVMTELINSPSYAISRSKLLARNIAAIDAIDLDRVVDTLIQADAITCERRGSEVFYILTAKGIEAIQYVQNLEDVKKAELEYYKGVKPK